MFIAKFNVLMNKISPKVLNELAENVAPLLTFIFTTSRETGRIPHHGKAALVTPRTETKTMQSIVDQYH